MLRFALRRLVIMIPTVIAIAIVSFALIQLPPGDFLSAYISGLEAQGEYLEEDEVHALEVRYGLDQPLYVQFFRWISGVAQGDFGMSFRWNKPVADLIGDRLALTAVISLTSMLITYIVALPIGVYSATHQYSVLDYVMTFISFVGRGTPAFMLALILMWLALSQFGISAGGLFSLEYRQAPWSWAKLVDMLRHIWVPLLVLSTGSTAGMIRIMRANLLDELRKPYVETARAKGVAERKLIWKYPVRMALNPFVSSLGWQLPRIISGATIVSVVLSLPTTGPLLLDSLMSQDMYLAGSMLLFLGILTVIGTFISDILLAVVDPRIRLG